MIFMMVITMVFVLKMTKFWKMERKKLILFRRALPTKTFFPFPRPTEGRPRKKKSGLSKGAENAFKWVKFAMAKGKKKDRKTRV